ncbi:hypothetical protein HYE82_10195 [Streptomyces sp. BR123]|uniref:hypothetical protein n=1 Tax=Streptomyces sp. BR123 TaxID=2749828 RepID=UPI0015C488A8|nr:hypothetical protein [Streptomyces sp. BR123]NXY94755.1 hypothetical protein [Streptomyces sp. BR123]
MARAPEGGHGRRVITVGPPGRMGLVLLLQEFGAVEEDPHPVVVAGTSVFYRVRKRVAPT